MNDDAVAALTEVEKKTWTGEDASEEGTMVGDWDENWKQPRDSPPLASPWGTWWKERGAHGRVEQA